jgi:hypothetical protein
MQLKIIYLYHFDFQSMFSLAEIGYCERINISRTILNKIKLKIFPWFDLQMLSKSTSHL